MSIARRADSETRNGGPPNLKRGLARLERRIMALVEKVPSRERAQIAHQLRETAKIVERMRGKEG